MTGSMEAIALSSSAATTYYVLWGGCRRSCCENGKVSGCLLKRTWCTCSSEVIGGEKSVCLMSLVLFNLLQVDTALKALGPDDDEVVKDELQLKKTMAAAAKALQVRKLEVASILEVQRNASLLLTQGVTIPLENLLAMTKRRGLIALADGELPVWLATLSLT